MKKNTYDIFKRIGKLYFKKSTIYLPNDFDKKVINGFAINFAKNPAIFLLSFNLSLKKPSRIYSKLSS